jgi:histidinol-phosphate aminotransferase
MATNRRAFLGTTAAALAWGCGVGGSMPPATTPVARPGAAPGPTVPPVIRLGGNENPYGPSERALAAARNALGEACRYADLGELTAAIAARHGVPVDHVMLGTGSFAILVATVAAAMRGGGSAVVPVPSFDIVGEYAATFGPVTNVPLDATFRHDLEAMGSAITPATRLVYVCNPNNPTSTLVNTADLAAFCQRYAGRTLVMVDEAYAEYVADFTSMDRLVRDGLPIVVVRTFSKLFGLAGLRVGYAIAPPGLVASLRAARGPADRLWIGAPGARAALASLGDDAYVARIRREVGEVRTRFVGALERLGLAVPPPCANFLYVPHAKADALVAAMAARGIKISVWSEQRGCRITIGLPSEMTAAAEALAAVVPTLT